MGHVARTLSVVLGITTGVIALAACGSSGGSRSGSPAAIRTAFLNFSRCMRAHGVSNFPDPSAQGGISLPLGSGLDPAAPDFQAAQRTCNHLLPGGGPPTQVPERVKVQMVKFAQCMRAHGVPNYPDPIFQGGGIVRQTPSGLDPSSPSFQTASKSCGNPA